MFQFSNTPVRQVNTYFPFRYRLTQFVISIVDRCSGLWQLNENSFECHHPRPSLHHLTLWRFPQEKRLLQECILNSAIGSALKWIWHVIQKPLQMMDHSHSHEANIANHGDMFLFSKAFFSMFIIFVFFSKKKIGSLRPPNYRDQLTYCLLLVKFGLEWRVIHQE